MTCKTLKSQKKKRKGGGDAEQFHSYNYSAFSNQSQGGVLLGTSEGECLSFLHHSDGGDNLTLPCICGLQNSYWKQLLRS